MLAEISDKNTMLSFETERQVLLSLNADCSTPVGAISKVENDRITPFSCLPTVKKQSAEQMKFQTESNLQKGW